MEKYSIFGRHVKTMQPIYFETWYDKRSAEHSVLKLRAMGIDGYVELPQVDGGVYEQRSFYANEEFSLWEQGT